MIRLNSRFLVARIARSRPGMMVPHLENGKPQEKAIDGGNPKLLRAAGQTWSDEAGIRHNIYPWDAIYENDNFFKGGWAGQDLPVNPTRDAVAVFTSYFKDDRYSEVSLEQELFEMLGGVFGDDEGD